MKQSVQVAIAVVFVLGTLLVPFEQNPIQMPYQQDGRGSAQIGTIPQPQYYQQYLNSFNNQPGTYQIFQDYQPQPGEYYDQRGQRFENYKPVPGSKIDLERRGNAK